MDAIRTIITCVIRLALGLGLIAALGACLCSPRPVIPPDAFEPNDTIAQAKPFTSPADANIAEGETDTFSFTATKDERVRLDLTITSGVFLAFGLAVKTPSGTTITSNQDTVGAGPSSLEFVAPSTGTFILVVVGGYTGPPDSLCAYGQGEYRLSRTPLGTPNIVTERTSNSLTLEWPEVAGASGYRLERQTGPTTWQPVTIPATSPRKVTDRPLAPDTAYTYRISVQSGGIYGTYSLWAQVEARTFKPFSTLLLTTTSIGNQYLPTRYIKSDMGLQVSLNDSPDTTVTLEGAGGPPQTLSPPYTYTFPASTLPEGAYTLRAVASRPGETTPSNNLNVIVDRTKPTVIAKTPDSGATNVPVNATVNVTFSEDLAVLGSNLSLEKTATGALVATTPSSTGNTQIRLTPNAPLEAGTSYTVRVLGGGPLPGTGSTDRAGNAPDPLAWSFTTQP